MVSLLCATFATVCACKASIGYVLIGGMRFHRKDCSERHSFSSESDGMGFLKWMRDRGYSAAGSLFQCSRCDRWHMAPSRKSADMTKREMLKERCLSDFDLHLQMARVIGVSLEELQTRIDLSKIKIGSGSGVRLVSVPNPKHPS